MALRQHPCSQAGENKRIRGKQNAREKKEADDTSGDAGTEAMGDREQGCVDSEQSNGEDRAMLGPNEEAAAEALDDHGHAAMEHREQGCVDSEQPNGEDRAMLGPNEEAAAEALDDHGQKRAMQESASVFGHDGIPRRRCTGKKNPNGEDRAILGPPNEEAEAEALDDHGHAAMEHRRNGTPWCVLVPNNEDPAVLGPNKGAAAEALDDHGHAAMEMLGERSRSPRRRHDVSSSALAGPICIICSDRQQEYAFQACGHLALCGTCHDRRRHVLQQVTGDVFELLTTTHPLYAMEGIWTAGSLKHTNKGDVYMRTWTHPNVASLAADASNTVKKDSNLPFVAADARNTVNRDPNQRVPDVPDSKKRRRRFKSLAIASGKTQSMKSILAVRLRPRRFCHAMSLKRMTEEMGFQDSEELRDSLSRQKGNIDNVLRELFV